MSHFTNKPCAADGLTSYRYKGQLGWIMIGAKNEHEALREALRSIECAHSGVSRDNLQVWDLISGKYVSVP